MTARRKAKRAEKERASKHYTNRSVVDEEVGPEEEKENLSEADFVFLESRSAQQLRSGLIYREEDPLAPWYFTHV